MSRRRDHAVAGCRGLREPARRPSLRAALAIVLLLPLLLPACRVPSRRPGIAAGEVPILLPVDGDLVHAEEIIVEILRLNGATIPDAALARALHRLERHVGGRISIVDRGSVPCRYDEDGYPAALHWPASHADPETGERLPVDRPRWFTHADGGVIGLYAGSAETGDGTTDLLMPILRANAIAILVHDHVPAHTKASGFTTMAPQPVLHASSSPDAIEWALRHREIHLFQPRIRGRIRLPFVSRDTYWEWIIFHEIGHCLRVPSAPDRTYVRNGPHCIRPDCVMYSPADWRMVMQIILHGWSLDFCEACAAELAEARTRPPRTDPFDWPPAHWRFETETRARAAPPPPMSGRPVACCGGP